MRHHEKASSIQAQVHRFRCTEPEGLFRLSKDITRLVTDRFDIELLKSLGKPGEDPELGSLKRLERIVTAAGFDGRSLMGPLFAIRDLRLADAHLPATEVAQSLRPLGVGSDDADVQAGKKVIHSAAVTINGIADVIGGLARGGATTKPTEKS